MTWLAVAKKEYLENVRNAWVVSVTLAFFVLTLLASVFASFSAFDGSAGATFANLVSTVAAMQTFSGFLLPILALMLGFATLAGERESGSLGLLVAQPLSRGQILMGKYLGLYGVLATAVVVGFGGGGLIILGQTSLPGAGFQVLLLFLVETLLWAAAWLSITVLVSAWFRRRGTAIAGSIGAWFLFGSFVWNMLTLVLVGLVYGPEFFQILEEGREAPGWLILTQVLNPNAVYDGLLVTTIADYPALVGGLAREILPDLYTMTTFLAAMAAWIGLPYWGAWALFRSRDV